MIYKRRFEWPNGAVCVVFSGEEPEQLRGPECELCVIDEIARMRHQSQVFDNAMLGLRLGEKPRILIATTPRPTPSMKNILKLEKPHNRRVECRCRSFQLTSEAFGGERPGNDRRTNALDTGKFGPSWAA